MSDTWRVVDAKGRIHWPCDGLPYLSFGSASLSQYVDLAEALRRRAYESSCVPNREGRIGPGYLPKPGDPSPKSGKL